MNGDLLGSCREYKKQHRKNRYDTALQPLDVHALQYNHLSTHAIPQTGNQMISLTTCPDLTLSSQANAIRSELTASST
jgi:hypothetical protein